MDGYPVTFDVVRPERWDRVQVLLRLLILVALGFLGIQLGWVFVALYLALPVIAAVLISQRGAEAYLQGPGAQILQVLRWWDAGVAYLGFVTDRFPTSTEDLTTARLDAWPGGSPTVGTALSRLITSLPELLVLAILSWVGAVMWLIAAVVVLFTEQVPDFAWRFQRYVVALQARLLVYHASLIEQYPPIGVREEEPPALPS